MSVLTDPVPRKDVALEALRGLAAFIVVFWHMLLAFAPGRVPVLGGDQSASILGQPWFGLVYGTSSVTFFFVLSGFVLARKALLRSDPAVLARGAVKRWPRLAGTVTVAVLFSWLLFVLHAYRYAPAAAITGSPWLASFGTAIPVGAPFKPNFGHAFWGGAFDVFFRGQPIDFTYDSSLWTMPVEFLGSFVVFGLAAILIALRGGKPAVRWWTIGLAVVICDYSKPLMVCFVIGVALAELIGERRPSLPWPMAVFLGVLAMWLAGFVPEHGWYGWLTIHLHIAPDETYVHTAASVLAILIIEATPPLRRLLSGRLSTWLGKLSFPLYLLHVPILCSAGCAVFLLSGSKPAAMITTVVVTIVLAVPLAVFDTWWVRRTGALADRLVPRQATPQSG